jgi:TfoX/Sxy family transcriptional regulator of competence genes
MPCDPGLAARLESLLSGRPGYQAKKMFGGIGWMLNGNMCVAIYKDWLIARVGVEAEKKVLSNPHTKPFDITGKLMKGWIMIAPEGIDKDRDLEKVVQLAESFVKTLPKK